MISLWSCVGLVNLHGSLTLSRCLGNSFLLYDKPFLCFSSSFSSCCCFVFVCLFVVVVHEERKLQVFEARTKSTDRRRERHRGKRAVAKRGRDEDEARARRGPNNSKVSTQNGSESRLHRFDTNCLYVPSSAFRHSLLVSSSAFRHKLSPYTVFNVRHKLSP